MHFLRQCCDSFTPNVAKYPPTRRGQEGQPDFPALVVVIGAQFVHYASAGKTNDCRVEIEYSHADYSGVAIW